MPASLDITADHGPERRFESWELDSGEASGQRSPAEASEEGLTNDHMTNVATVEPIPPDGGYGWVCAFAVFLINAHTWGVNSVSCRGSSTTLRRDSMN